MTEAEWLATDHVVEMCGIVGQFCHGNPFAPDHPVGMRLGLSRRAASLFAVGCVRATPQAADQPFLMRVVAEVERAADAERDLRAEDWDDFDENLKPARPEDGAPDYCWTLIAHCLTTNSLPRSGFDVPGHLLEALGRSKGVRGLRRVYADLLRDVVGNPFRGGRGGRMKKPTKAHTFPILRATHVTPTVRDIARGMYESRDFGAMPILADALQDAGCTSDDILNHCRHLKQVHVRGCWVVDLVLGKE